MERWVCLSDGLSRSVVLCALFLSFFTEKTDAQVLPVRERMQSGEQVTYDLFFKWGILMPRAGQAILSFQEMPRVSGDEAYSYRLLFRTSGMFDKVYKMRDTIDCFLDWDMRLLRSEKRVNENDYYLVDLLDFQYAGDETAVHSVRYTPKQTKIDTVMRVSSKPLFDMLGSTLFLRSIDWTALNSGDSFPFYVAVGRDIISICFRYTGQRVVQHDRFKYRTRHFYIDIYDDAFTHSKEAAELWVGDDENRIPVKIRAKLKIGAAEVYYKKASGLLYPLTSRIEIPARR